MHDDWISYYWFAFSALLLLLEALGIQGVGLLFAGLAAGMIGTLLEFSLLSKEALILQWGLWFAATAVLALVLYKPLKRWRTNPEAKETFHNMVGTTAKVGAGGLMLGKPGRVLWSGTHMNAMIAAHSTQEAFLEGDMVKVADVRGNQLMVVAMQQDIHMTGKET